MDDRVDVQLDEVIERLGDGIFGREFVAVEERRSSFQLLQTDGNQVDQRGLNRQHRRRQWDGEFDRINLARGNGFNSSLNMH